MDRKDLERLTLRELRETAIDAGIPQARRRSRVALIEALVEARPEAASSLLAGSSSSSAGETADGLTPQPAAGRPAPPSPDSGLEAVGLPALGPDEATSVPEESPAAVEAGRGGREGRGGTGAVNPAGRSPSRKRNSPAPLEPGQVSLPERGPKAAPELDAPVPPPTTGGVGVLEAAEALVDALPPTPEVVSPPATSEEPPPIEPYLDRGPPLPARLNEDYFFAVARDPWLVFVTWELSDDTRSRPISDGSGRDFIAGSWELRVFGRRGEVLTSPGVEWKGEWWVPVFPDTPGVACIGAVSPSGRFCPVAWSQPFRSPRDSASLDRSVRWLRVELRREEAPAESLIRRPPSLPSRPVRDGRRWFGIETTEEAELEAAVARSVPVGEAGARHLPGGWPEPAKIEPELEAVPSWGGPGPSPWLVAPTETGPVPAEQIERLGGIEMRVFRPAGSSELVQEWVRRPALEGREAGGPGGPAPGGAPGLPAPYAFYPPGASERFVSRPIPRDSLEHPDDTPIKTPDAGERGDHGSAG